MRKILCCAAAVLLMAAAWGADVSTPAKKKTVSKSAGKAHKKAKAGPASKAGSQAARAKAGPASKAGSQAAGGKAVAGKAAGSRTTASRRGKSGKKGPVYRATWRDRQLAPTPDRYKEIQNALVAKGFLKPEDASGAWTPACTDALKKFQSAQNLEASGKINSLSLIALGLGPRHETAAAKLPEASKPPEVR